MTKDDFDMRLNAAVEHMVQIASGNLDARSTVSGSGDQLDAIVAGLNMLAEELDHERRARRLAEELLADVRAAYDSVPGLLCTVDADLTILKCNQTFRNVINKTLAEVIGRPLQDFCDDDDRDRLQTRLHDLPLHATAATGTYVLLDDGAGITVEMTATRVRSANQKERLRILFHDVTERLRADAAKAALEAQLFQAQKMESIGQLAGGIAHDFNNMLSAILGFTSLAQMDTPPEDPVHESLDEIITVAKRAADLTRQLLGFSRRQVIAPKVLDLGHSIADLHNMLDRVIGDDIILRTVRGENVGAVRVDPGQIEQIILNLAVNARDAMPNGGKLLIETIAVDLDQEYADRHHDTAPGSYTVLCISDNGEGMDAATKQKIFEPFFTTKELGKGTGLGLATVFGIVQQAGGRIEVYSEPGQGTSFKIYFPRVDGTAATLTASDPSQIIGGSETILVVEDDGTVRALAQKLFQHLGYRVLIAADGADAIKLAAHYEEPIALLFTDVVMPHMNGRDLAAAIKTARPDIKVLFTSGYTRNVIAHHSVLYEGVEFLPKPYTLEELAQCLRATLDN